MSLLTVDNARALLALVPAERITEVLADEQFPPLKPDGTGDTDHPLWPVQSRVGEEQQGFAAYLQIRAMVANKWFWEMARTLPNNDVVNTGRPGAPQHYPDWLLFLFHLVAGLRQHGTYGQSQGFFKDRAEWNKVAKYIDQWVPEEMTSIYELEYRKPRNESRPIAKAGTTKTSRTTAHRPRRIDPRLRLDGPAYLEPKIDPPSPHHLDHFRLRWRGIDTVKSTKSKAVRIPVGHRDYGMRNKVLAAFRHAAQDQATSMGLFDDNVPFALRKPNRNNWAGADGVVFEMVKRGIHQPNRRPVRDRRRRRLRQQVHDLLHAHQRSVPLATDPRLPPHPQEPR
jgi:hypothetical protein